MRIPEALISPKGAFVFTGVTAGFGFIAVALEQAEGERPALVYIFGALAVFSFLVVLAALYEHYRRYLWIIGGPVAFGLILGITGWLIWDLLYSVLIGLAAWALMQASSTVWAIGKSATTANPSTTERITDEEWAMLPLTPVADATFRNQPVPLDGYAYDGCTFVRCTFVYKGEKPYTLRYFKLEDDWNVEAASPQLFHFSALLSALKLLGKDVEIADELQPNEPVAHGEVQRPLEPDDPSEKDKLKAKAWYWDNRRLFSTPNKTAERSASK